MEASIHWCLPGGAGLSLPCFWQTHPRVDAYPNDKENAMRTLSRIIWIALALSSAEAGPLFAVQGGLPMSVEKTIQEKAARLGSTYAPRTRHLNIDGTPKFTNRLFLEQSPYLLQHAHNPVNWYPWGEEAFALARKTERPILVSIGYATCHWCHVMEEESFEDLEIAKALNTHFVAIKVDREERPDIDGVYMNAVQILTGTGGWPLNVFLFPDGKPFYGGTYFPARDGDRPPNPGFLILLNRITELYTTQQETLRESADRLTHALQSLEKKTESMGPLPNKEWIEKAIDGLTSLYDPANGGTKGAPKFPATLPVELFLRRAYKTKNEAFRQMAHHTLTAMADGGIHDQVGGGFHRYSTDAKWLVPHFEKMLYDNALLASLYLDGYLANGDDRFKEVCLTTLDYLTREMQHPHGGFYSATDADSLTPSGHKEEGYFFTWSKEELEKALPETKWKPYFEFFQLKGAPHFEGRYIPHRNQSKEEVAKAHGLSLPEIETLIKKGHHRLYEARKTRKAPLTDQKIVAAWNGLALSAFARAGRHLQREDYLNVARRTATTLLKRLMHEGRLHRSFLEERGPKGFLEDYAFVTQGLLDLFEATGEGEWLEKAVHLQHETQRLFAAPDGGFFMDGSDTPHLVAREKPGHDGATPSANGVAAMNLFRFYALTTDTNYLTAATKTVSAFPSMKTAPAAYTGILAALEFHLNDPVTQLLVLPKVTTDTVRERNERAEQSLSGRYNPYAIAVRLMEKEPPPEPLKKLVQGKKAIGGSPTLYPCQSGICSNPITDFL